MSQNNPHSIARHDLERWDNFEGLQFSGQESSREIFPHFGLDWHQIAAAAQSSGLPVADLGSAFSTFPVEAALKEIAVVPVDVMRPHRVRSYREIVCDSVTELVRSGILDAAPLDLIMEKIETVERRYLAADIAAMPVPDRAFSIAIAHDCVPKHSATFEDFLRRSLPEILRITNQKAFIFPLQIYHAEPGENLILRDDIGADPQKIAAMSAVAQAHGFEFTSYSIPESSGGGYSGIFNRIEDTGGPSVTGQEILEIAEARAWLPADLRSWELKNKQVVNLDELRSFSHADRGGPDCADIKTSDAASRQRVDSSDQVDWANRGVPKFGEFAKTSPLSAAALRAALRGEESLTGISLHDVVKEIYFIPNDSTYDLAIVRMVAEAACKDPANPECNEILRLQFSSSNGDALARLSRSIAAIIAASGREFEHGVLHCINWLGGYFPERQDVEPALSAAVEKGILTEAQRRDWEKKNCYNCARPFEQGGVLKVITFLLLRLTGMSTT